MNLQSLSRGKQMLLGGALVLTMAVVGLFAFPEEASACIPCVGSKTVCSGCMPWGVKCTDYELQGCYPNPGCSWVPVRTYLIPGRPQQQAGRDDPLHDLRASLRNRRPPRQPDLLELQDAHVAGQRCNGTYAPLLRQT